MGQGGGSACVLAANRSEPALRRGGALLHSAGEIAVGRIQNGSCDNDVAALS